jgi:curved DNA-binding protein CbpA
MSLRALAETIHSLSYYEILGVDPSATTEDIVAAFHEFALECHPDRHVDEGTETAAFAAEIFKRGAEAYNILTKVELRKKYDAGLDHGRLRLDPERRSTVPPPPPVRTLEMIARTPAAKRHAIKADRLISIGKLDEARVQLVSAMQQDAGNEELEERLQILYDALALEPL